MKILVPVVNEMQNSSPDPYEGCLESFSGKD